MRTTLDSARKLFRALDTPRALTCEILVRHGCWDQLARLSIDPSHYLDARQYYLDVVATEYLRKHAQLPGGLPKRENALKKFMEAERLCAKTNARFNALRNGLFESDADARLIPFISSVKRIIAGVLGRLPDEVYPRFGPGATVDDRGRLTTVVDKMVSVPTLTKGTRCLLPLWKHTAWGREYLRRPEKRGRIREVDFGRFTTVPKNSLTDRSIDIQPSINVFYQLGVGSAIRARLSRYGIDLDRGQDTHRRVACDASLSGEMSTIDLSSASDTISKEVVKLLLPSDWHALLETLRTSFTRLPDGKKLFLEKFSAMGNGYTFELETLIFSGIVEACMKWSGLDPKAGHNYFVYGDDIIVPSSCAGVVLSALRYFGFVPNPEKTFIEGSFRESCGGDFFEGQPVRAHYLKEEPNEPSQIIALANGLRRVYTRLHPLDSARRRLIKVWFTILDELPSDVRRLRGPESLGDLVVHDCRGWDTRSVREDRSRAEIRVWLPTPHKLPLGHWPAWAQFAGALYGIDSQGVAPRGGTSGYRKAWVALIERPA